MFAVDNTIPSLVLDIGTHTSKAGFAGEDLPQSLLPTVLGVKENEDGPKSSHVAGSKLLVRRDGMEVVSPLDDDAIVSNWNDYERLLDHIFDVELVSSAAEHAIMLAEPVFNIRTAREKMCELLFEKYNAPAMYLGKSAVLAALANSRTTGVVLDVGASAVTAAPVFEGAVVKNKALRVKLAGNAVSAAVRRQLEAKSLPLRPWYSFRKRPELDEADNVQRVVADGAGGDPDGEAEESRVYRVEDISCPGTTASFHNFCQAQLVDQVKEALCRVREQSKAEGQSSAVASYELPDGSVVEMEAERFEAPEVLFSKLAHAPLVRPGSAPLDAAMLAASATPTSSEGLSGLAWDAVQRCDAHMQDKMLTGVCLTGGTSNFGGMYERITNELLLKFHKLRVLAATGVHERRYCAWTGGSILATFSEFQKMWFSRGEYDENGSSFVHKKCA